MAGQRSLADRLNRLFDDVRGPGLKPYSNHQVAAAINQRAAGLSAEGRSAIAAIIDQVRKLEGLPPGTSDNGLISS